MLNSKVTNLQAHVAEGQANVENKLDELREVMKKKKVEDLTKLRLSAF